METEYENYKKQFERISLEKEKKLRRENVELFHVCNEYQTKMQKLEREKNELLDLVEDTKNAYAWWIDEKGFKEPDKSDHEHYEKLIETLNKYGRTDH